jgi:hypothetical protein
LVIKSRSSARRWREQQHPNGTVIWKSPTGKTYQTLPGSRVFFPAWDTTTAPLPRLSLVVQERKRGVMMPKRQRTRAADRLGESSNNARSTTPTSLSGTDHHRSNPRDIARNPFQQFGSSAVYPRTVVDPRKLTCSTEVVPRLRGVQ